MMKIAVLLAVATIPSWVILFVVLFLLFGFFGNRTLAPTTYSTTPWPWYGSWSPLGAFVVILLLWYFFGPSPH